MSLWRCDAGQAPIAPKASNSELIEPLGYERKNMAHDKVYGRNLYKKNQYLLQGSFWDGFRKSCKWTAPAYAIFFCIATIGSNTVWQALWCLLMVVVSVVVIYLAWKAAE